MKGQNGSASVWIMLVLSAILLLQSVLVDYARNRVAMHRADQALESALRSVFSDFDTGLQAYGLYGFQETDALKEGVTEHFQSVVASDGMTLARFDDWAEMTEWSVTGSLGDYELFRKQVLDEMAYRAPLEWSFTFWDKLRGNDVAGEMTTAKSFGEDAKQIEALLEERDSALKRAWQETGALLEAGGTVPGWVARYQAKLLEIRGYAERAGVAQLDELQRNIQQVQQSIGELSMLEPSQALAANLQALHQRLNDLQETLNAYMRFTAELHMLAAQIDMDNERLQQWQARYDRYLQQAEQKERDIRRKLEQREQTITYAEQLLMGADYYANNRSSAAELLAMHNQAAQALKDPAFRFGQSFVDRYDVLDRSVRNVSSHAARWHAALQQSESRREAAESQRKSQEKQAKQSLGSVLAKAERMISGCGASPNDAYLQLPKDRYGQASESDAGTALPGIDDIGLQSLDWGGKLEQSLYQFRDRMFVNEFALAKFNYRTFVQSRETAFRDPHVLYNQELEYILYGFPSCHLNRAAAFAEMFAIRLAVRTTEALAKPGKAGLAAVTPWLFFLSAVAEGAAKAWSDMERLLNGEEVELASRVLQSIRLGYKDYLRLFMAVHGNEENMIRRMQQLVDLNTGVNLHHAASAAEVRASGRLKGTMFPLAGDRSIIRAEAAYAY